MYREILTTQAAFSKRRGGGEREVFFLGDALDFRETYALHILQIY